MAAAIGAFPTFAHCSLFFRRFSSCSVLSKRIGNYIRCGQRSITASALKLKENKISVTFVDHNETKEFTVTGPENSTLLQLIRDNDLDFNGYGSCDGGLACATCHVILSQEDYDKIPSKVSAEENDMLDIAVGITDTSRLGCQVAVTKELSGLKVKVGPEDTQESLQKRQQVTPQS